MPQPCVGQVYEPPTAGDESLLPLPFLAHAEAFPKQSNALEGAAAKRHVAAPHFVNLLLTRTLVESHTRELVLCTGARGPALEDRPYGSAKALRRAPARSSAGKRVQ